MSARHPEGEVREAGGGGDSGGVGGRGAVDVRRHGGGMACLDEVMAVDTSAAHLVGALGMPTRIWLGTMTDRRWGTEGEQTT
ncbi:MAG: hypothetical protein MUF18_11205 [Fimbriiglobus sp.]|nr:hypothetical protein [Fimbriiglobus sp.]